MRFRILLVMLLPLLILIGCRQTTQATADNIDIDVALDTEMPAVGDATLLVTVMTEDGTAVNDATVTVRGDMTHAMPSVIPEAVSEADEGVYSIPFEFTMGGDWIITVDVTLANGDTASVVYEIDGVEGEMDMDDMNMDDMDMSSAVIGAYMSITNNGEEDVTLVAVSAEGVGMIQIHETSVDDNDMASMEQLENGLMIAAGETVELVPGGLHIMLMNLENDLIEGETIALTLEFDDGTSVELDVPIMVMMTDDGEAVEVDNLSITGFWARPSVPGDDAMDMDTEGTEEATMNMDMDTEATEESE